MSRNLINLWALALFFVVLVNLTVQRAEAVPAYPYPITVTQEDGTKIQIRIHGDEFFGWTTTLDDYPIAKKNGNYYYAEYSADGEVTISEELVGAVRNTPLMRRAKSVDMVSIAQQVSERRRAASGVQKSAAFPNSGIVKSVVLLVEYSDVRFVIPDPNQAFSNQLNQQGYSVEGATGSARDYFLAQSKGQFEGEFDVYGPYTLSNPRSYYGAPTGSSNDSRPREMVVEAVQLADAAGVDFAQYDLDANGDIDNIFVYYAGHNQAEGGGEDTIWPHKWATYHLSIVVDGKRTDAYACSSELRGYEGATIAGIGTFSHEFSHVLGLADHYDTSGSSDGVSHGLARYDIMTNGSYNNSGNTPPMMNGLELEMIGWCMPKEFTGSEEVVIKPIQHHDIYKIPTEVEGEYFLIENRNKESIVWDYHIPFEADGLMITHVDRSADMMLRWIWNQPNGNPEREGLKFVVASNKVLNSYQNWWDAPWEEVPYPFGLNNRWNNLSTPQAESRLGEELRFGIQNIKKVGQNIVFDVLDTIPTAVESITVSQARSEISYVGVPLQLSAAVQPVEAPYNEVVWLSSDSDAATISDSGEVLFLMGDKEVTFTARSVTYPDVESSIELTAQSLVSMPMLYIPKYEYSEGEQIELKAINLNEGDEIEWYMLPADDENMGVLSAEPIEGDTVTAVVGEWDIKCRLKRGGEAYIVTRQISVK